MALWNQVECGLDSANETLNFGTRILAENDALYETVTLAVIRTSDQVDKDPIVKCLNQNNKVFLAIENTFKIFSNNCNSLDANLEFASSVNIFCVSSDGNLVVVCLNDGQIHCFHGPSGAKLMCTALTIESIGQIFDDLNSGVEPQHIDFKLENLFRLNSNSKLVHFNYEKNSFYLTSHRRARFADCGNSFITSLDENGTLIALCKLTNLEFNLYNEDKIHDFIFVKSLTLDHHLLVLTSNPDSEKQSSIKLLSYLNFDTIYTLKVSETSYLVDLGSEKDEVMLIEGIRNKGAEYVNELRLKIITESVPQEKLRRFLRRKSFEEAKKFARLFNLNLQPVFEAEAEEFIIQSDFQLKNLDEFCGILDNITNVGFVTQYCLQNITENLKGTERLLKYADGRLLAALQNNPEDEYLKEMRTNVLNTVYKLDTFKFLYDESKNLMDEWVYFLSKDLLDEMYNFLKNGKVQKCAIIFSRLQQKNLLNFDVLRNILKLIPSYICIMDLLPLLQNMLLCSLELNCVAYVMDWLYNTVVNFDSNKTSDWLECLLQFTENIATFLHTNESNLFLQQHVMMKNGCVTQFRKLITALNEIIILKQNYGVQISLSDYLQDPKAVVNILLEKVMISDLSNFIKNILVVYTNNRRLNLDDVLSEFIKEISKVADSTWEETVSCIIPFICANTLRLETILFVLEKADVPWTRTIERIAKEAANESHPLAEKVNWHRENIVWKMLLKKYSIFDTPDDKILMIRRIIMASKPDMTNDLDVVTSRYEPLKEKCYVLCFNSFIQKGEIEAALKLLNKLNSCTLIRCYQSVMISLQHFLFSKVQFVNFIENYKAVLQSCLKKLENIVPEYKFLVFQTETQRLKNIAVLREKYKCSEITDIDFNLKLLKSRLVNSVVQDVNENKYGWAEAISRCENISFLLGLRKEECFFEVANQCGQLEGLLNAAQEMIDSDSQTMDLCHMAILLMKNIDNSQNEDSFRNKSLTTSRDGNVAQSSQVVRALQMAYNLALKAFTKASPLEIHTACEILHWTNISFWLRKQPNTQHYLPHWHFTPLFRGEIVHAHSQTTAIILKEIFEIFIRISGEKHHSTFEEDCLEVIESLPGKVLQLHTEGYDMTAYVILNLVKIEIINNSSSAEFHARVKDKISAILNGRCVAQLLNKVFVSKRVDHTLAMALILTPKFDALKWIATAIKKYKSDVKKLHSVAILAYHTLELKGKSADAYLHLKYRCEWWQKILHNCITYKDNFHLTPEKIVTKYLLKCDKLTVKLLYEFCKNFSLNVQIFLPEYLKNTLLEYRTPVEVFRKTKQEHNGTKEIDLFVKCKDIINHMEDKSVAVHQLNNAWNEVSYYQYEVYLCIIKLLEDLDETCTNEDQKFLLKFLNKYIRIRKPQQKENDEWQTKYPFSRYIDPLSEYRLPYFLAMFSKDIWEIIRPEINLATYECWLHAATILQLNKDDICVFAIKGSIYNGVLCSNQNTVWLTTSRHDVLLKSMELCVSQIANLEKATAVLYQAVCNVTEGVDQVSIAKMCYKKAMHWKKSMAKSEVMNDVWIKVKRKYINCLSKQTLYSHNLGSEKYLALVESTEQLIRALYNDESIVNRIKGGICHLPDINITVNELAEHLLKENIIDLRTTLIMECLQESTVNLNLDDTYYNGSPKFLTPTLHSSPNSDTEDISDNLKRVIYICESSDKETCKDFLYNIVFCKLDETVSRFIITPDLRMRVKALQCLLVICDDSELDENIGHPASSYLEKLQILVILEMVGYSLSVEELDMCNKEDLLRKILRNNPREQRIFRTLAKLAAHYQIWITDIWNGILHNFLHLQMDSDLQKWLPKLYDYCYTPSAKCVYVAGWDFLITNCFHQTLIDGQGDSPYFRGFLLVQVCPVTTELESCFSKIFEQYLENKEFTVCAMFLPYIYNDNCRKGFLKALEPQRSAKFYEKILNFKLQGILKTDHAVSILMNYSNN